MALSLSRIVKIPLELRYRVAILMASTASGVFISRYCPISSLELYYSFIPISAFLTSVFVAPLTSQYLGSIETISSFKAFLRFYGTWLLILVVVVCVPVLILVPEANILLFLYFLVDLFLGTFIGTLITSLSMFKETLKSAKLALFYMVVTAIVPVVTFYAYNWDFRIYLYVLLLAKAVSFAVAISFEERTQMRLGDTNFILDRKKYLQGILSSLILWSGQHLPKLLLLWIPFIANGTKPVIYLVAIQAAVFAIETVFRGVIEKSYKDGEILSLEFVTKLIVAFFILVPFAFLVVQIYAGGRDWDFSFLIFVSYLVLEVVRFILNYISLKYQLVRRDFRTPILLSICGVILVVVANLGFIWYE